MSGDPVYRLVVEHTYIDGTTAETSFRPVTTIPACKGLFTKHIGDTRWMEELGYPVERKTVLMKPRIELANWQTVQELEEVRV